MSDGMTTIVAVLAIALAAYVTVVRPRLKARLEEPRAEIWEGAVDAPAQLAPLIDKAYADALVHVRARAPELVVHTSIDGCRTFIRPNALGDFPDAITLAHWGKQYGRRMIVRGNLRAEINPWKHECIHDISDGRARHDDKRLNLKGVWPKITNV